MAMFIADPPDSLQRQQSLSPGRGLSRRTRTVPIRLQNLRSEGCIRLLDADIITLKEKYAYVGMPVIIKAENEGLYDWEKKLEK